MNVKHVKADTSEARPCKRLDPKNPGITSRFFKPVYDDSGEGVYHLEDRSHQPSYHDTIVEEGLKCARGTLRQGDRRMQCYLFRLPLALRFRIYEELFKHDGSPLEVGRLRSTGIAGLSILRVSHTIYHEVSIALYHSLSYRKLFLRTFGAFSATFLTRLPRSLPRCDNREHKSAMNPCFSHKLGWHRPLGSVLILLGSTDFKTALLRRWSFMEFIKALARDGPIHIYNLTIVATDNWRVDDFDEKQLIKALFSGAFGFLGKLNFKGFTEEERNRLWKLLHNPNLPHLKLDREKKKKV
ncbi:hypothetical protein BJX70DRAFT_362871 [Aspergillus crustosus]